MIDLDGLSLQNLESSYLVANTPQFLVKTFRSDPAVIKISQSGSIAEIEESLEKFLAQPPENLREKVLPFVMLMALSLKRDRLSLQRAAALRPDAYKWFRPVAELLLASAVASNQMTIRAGSSGVFKPTTIRSAGSSAYTSIRLEPTT